MEAPPAYSPSVKNQNAVDHHSFLSLDLFDNDLQNLQTFIIKLLLTTKLKLKQ